MTDVPDTPPIFGNSLGFVLSIAGAGVTVFAMEPIGLLGFVPWFTFAAFSANARRTKRSSDGQRGVVAGALLGIVLPLTLATAVGFGTWIIAPHAAAIPAPDFEKMLIHQNGYWH
jgi:hypothetical protein